MADLFQERSAIYKQPTKDIFDEQASSYATEEQEEQESTIGKVLKHIPKPLGMPELSGSIDGNLIEGLKASAIGQMLGFNAQYPAGDASLGESLKFKAGALSGDIPAMSLGSVGGGALAGLLGAGPLGAAIGAGAGAFGLPELVKQIATYIKKPSGDTFVDKLGNIADIPIQTGKQALIGAATGGAGRLAPLLKFGNSKIGQEVIKSGAELAAMTGAGAAIEGELPSAREVAENALLLGGMKVAGAGAKGIERIIGKEGLPKSTPKQARAELDIFKERALELAPKKVKAGIEKFKKEQPYFDVLRDVVGKKHERIVISQEKWNETFDKAQGKEPYTPKQLEDAIHYAQRNPNPEIANDSFQKLHERTPKSLRNLIDKDLREHFKTTLEERNKNPYLKSVVPREEVVQKYLPGLYENPEKFDSVSKKLRVKDPFTNQKEFLNYNEALIKGGLKPRYKDLRKIVQVYDEIVAKEFAAADMLENIQKIEKEQDRKLIVTKHDKAEYINALHDGYERFDDHMLRRINKDGMSEHPTDAPALVAPEVASSLRGIFNKDAYKPGNKVSDRFWKGYDALADTIRTGRVKASFFHYVPLAESAAGALGGKKVFGMRGLMKQGESLIDNFEFRKDAARSGLVIHKPAERWETAQRVSSKMVDTAMKYLPEKVTTKAQESIFNKGLTKYINSQKYLFEKFHPRLKSVVWKNYVDGFIDKGIKEGKPPSPEQVIKIKKQMADRVNAEFGGQNWEIQRGFNNPEYRKWLKRVIAYPDWTTSAIKQAAGVLSGGLKGEQSRKYFLRVGLNTMLLHGTLKYLFGGFKKADPGDKLQVGGAAWSPKKAKEEITSPDPSEWYKFPLPDVPFNIAGIKFNPGREAPSEWKKVGSKLYTHSGKQFLEIKDWYKNPAVTFFNKSNPLLSMVYKQMMGRTPSKGDREGFAVRGKFSRGKFEPWDATKSGTGARAVSRIASIAEEPIPFSFKAAKQHGIASFVATGFGAVPISKGTTPYKAAPELEKAFKKNDTKMVNRIRAALKDNGYTERQINKVVGISRRKVKK